MKIYIAKISTYKFGLYNYFLHIIAGSKSEAERLILEYPEYKKDLDSSIEDIKELADLNDITPRIL